MGREFAEKSHASNITLFMDVRGQYHTALGETRHLGRIFWRTQVLLCMYWDPQMARAVLSTALQ